MKKICDFVKNFVIIAYILLIIFVTICLLSYNDYKLTVFDGNTLIPVIDEDLEPKYTLGDLLIVKKNKLDTVKNGDEIFFYRVSAGETIINFGKVVATERVTETEYTFTIEGDYKFSSSNFIGKVETTKIIPKVGRVLSILQSKWGFLFLGVFPSLMAFLYTLYTVVLEVQVPEEDKKKNVSAKKLKHKNEELNNEDIPKERENNETETSEVDSTKEKIENTTKEEKLKEENTESTETNENKNINIPEQSTNTKKMEEINKDVTISQKEENKDEKQIQQTEEQKRRAIIEAKMKSMTEEEKKALIQAKLNSMSLEEKKALIEAKRKRMEAEKNKK